MFGLASCHCSLTLAFHVCAVDVVVAIKLKKLVHGAFTCRVDPSLGLRQTIRTVSTIGTFVSGSERTSGLVLVDKLMEVETRGREANRDREGKEERESRGK